ncbi:MAG: tryptophan--tRNA ligase [bacterium]
MSKIFSGVQPTNNLHIGNYLGAIKNWVEVQAKNDCIFCVVDLHAITVKQDPKILRKNIINTAKTYLALGIDPNKSMIFIQSDVKEHAELAWILSTVTKIAELERMTQFKDKAKQHKNNINAGLFTYPILMASDILLYDTESVPVGHDQSQHVELARMIAKKFNAEFGDTFKIPEAVIKKDGARIMGLDDPTKKMSKSAINEYSYISLLDDPAKARKKIMKAVTDSGSEVKAGANKPAMANLLTIYSLLSGVSVKEIENQYNGQGYGDFKEGLADVVVKFLEDFQTRFNKISDKEIKKTLQAGAGKAKKIAEKKMQTVKEKMGLSYQ